jgi:hypothetical protein
MREPRRVFSTSLADGSIIGPTDITRWRRSPSRSNARMCCPTIAGLTWPRPRRDGRKCRTSSATAKPDEILARKPSRHPLGQTLGHAVGEREMTLRHLRLMVKTSATIRSGKTGMMGGRHRCVRKQTAVRATPKAGDFRGLRGSRAARSRRHESIDRGAPPS